MVLPWTSKWESKGTTMLTPSYRVYGLWCEDGFTTKTMFVLDCHKTADPVGSMYAGTVSRERVRIAYTYTALNIIDIFTVDIWIDYLQPSSLRRDYIICGPDFGSENVWNVALIHSAIYEARLLDVTQKSSEITQETTRVETSLSRSRCMDETC